MKQKVSISKLSSKESSVEQSQFDQAQLEEVMDHHQHLSQILEGDHDLEEKLVVQSGKGTRVNMERVVEPKLKEEPSKFTPNEVVKTELAMVQLKGIAVDTHNTKILTQLLRGEDSWLHLFQAVPAYEVRAIAVELSHPSTCQGIVDQVCRRTVEGTG